MKKRLSKLYIIKLIIVRFICLGIINVSYFSLNNLIIRKIIMDKLATDHIYISQFFNKEISIFFYIGIDVINIIGIIFSLVMPIIEYFAYNYEITDESIEIHYGIIFRNYVYIPMENIKYSIIRRDPIDYVLGLSRVYVYTPAKRRVIRCLSHKTARELCKTIREKSLVKDI